LNVKTDISIIKGIHPGFILERELKLRKIRKGQFALSIQEYPQTLVTITKGKRKMNTSLALKIESALGLEEGFFMILQVYHDIEVEKRKQDVNYHPNLTMLRPVLFWDTKIEKIDWRKQKRAIIERVFERGNKEEKEEIIRFYGKETTDQVWNARNERIVNRTFPSGEKTEPK
jgi:plasmid maintenance system antidote protein VapI